ncbi:MAG: ClpXP protease specificity-enhancing factor [Duodenibacillus sp.]|nr:ClpXP protease specificity-enhancing factor [Duodenibacillus sp.]
MLHRDKPAIVIPLSRPEFKPYLIEALLNWCEDQGYTPYMLVMVDGATVVPREFVHDDDSIVLCVSRLATNQLSIQQDRITFQSRFSGRIREVVIPMGRVTAIYPKEDPDLASYFPPADTPASFGGQPADSPSDDDDLPTFTKL